MAETASTREAYGKTLAELAGENPDIVALDADLSASTMTKFLAKEYPDRFFDCGIAEANMVGIASGLAASGKIPFASTFAAFMPGRSFDQIRVSVAYNAFNVKLVATHSGISAGEDGASHQAIEDLALISSLPGFTVIVPADAIETAQAVKTAAATEGPFYIRLCRPNTPVIFDENYRFELGKAAMLKQGTDVTIIAIGILVDAAMQAAENLATKGINCRVLNMSTLKPIDEAAIISAAKDTGAIVTAEDHHEHGGLGSIVARIIVKNQPVPMEFVAMKDIFAKSGKPAELLERYGLSADGIEKAVRSVIKRKK
ncbi:transketolase family protein [Chloroflexota bacterium]